MTRAAYTSVLLQLANRHMMNMKAKGNFDQDAPKYAKEIQHIQDPVLSKRWDVQPCY
jgi:hypothetical protein